MKRQIPNLITLLNLFFGCLAIVVTFQSGTMATMDETGDMLIEIPEQIYYASMFIGLAALVDFFDGFAARLLNVNSDLGKQLDSLADVVSFGVAPSFIVFQFLRLSLATDINALSYTSILMAPAFIIALAGAYRLAKFNIDPDQSTYFKGVPIPMIGLLTAAFPLVYWQSQTTIFSKLLLNPIFWYVYIIVVSYLMVMDKPMLALKNFSGKKKLFLPLALVATETIISAYFFKWMAIPFGFIGYCLVSLFYSKTITQ
ncbi:MAG: CDP-alcohol phosphatidyltransferase [Chitinophagia bacterium]|nr:CDP-alcohol phosphatidyltransferase [Chitinophagia bacterium]NCA29403.1 CDP-alcohol phosphatidyltransferase [Chitinophagia bacterium]